MQKGPVHFEPRAAPASNYLLLSQITLNQTMSSVKFLLLIQIFIFIRTVTFSATSSFVIWKKEEKEYLTILPNLLENFERFLGIKLQTYILC